MKVLSEKTFTYPPDPAVLQFPTGGHDWKIVHLSVPDPGGFVVLVPEAVEAVDDVVAVDAVVAIDAVVPAVVLVVTGGPGVELPGIPPSTPV